MLSFYSEAAFSQWNIQDSQASQEWMSLQILSKMHIWEAAQQLYSNQLKLEEVQFIDLMPFSWSVWYSKNQQYS